MLLRNGCLVVAVDGSRISVFKNVGEAFEPVLELVEEERNPSPRSSELGTDKPGRSFASASPRRGAHETTDRHQLEEDRFAAEVAERIESMAKNSKENMVLVAAPRTLGMVRKHIDPKVTAKLLAEIPKDFGPDDAEPLAKFLAKYEN